jgi:hypothetical protein
MKLEIGLLAEGTKGFIYISLIEWNSDTPRPRKATVGVFLEIAGGVAQETEKLMRRYVELGRARL